ncbi:hypothetical protein BU15DRAFT_74836 [Melanogaster broomeanus]|nr:hypothetical protein BU15DRAFT_74836 [Melanogaster broomeanus]
MLSFLPAELIETIFDKLDIPSLLRCLQVCKPFHVIISQSTHLLYKIELFASHMDDGRHSGLDIASRSKLLESYNQGWREMRWAGCKVVPKEESILSRDLVGGILAYPLLNDHSISFVQLPCSIKGIPEKQWTVHLGVNIRDFYFDVAQDLLVCTELIDAETCKIHFFTLSTGTPHTLACTPIITHRIQGMPTWVVSRFMIQICGPRVVILFRYGGPHRSLARDFVAWDWCTGEQEMVCLLPSAAFEDVQIYLSVTQFIQCMELRSFSMLTDDLILAVTFPMPREPCLDVFSISECRRGLSDTPNCSPLQFADIPCICRFQLPRVREKYLDICMRSEPSPLATPSPSLRVPFSTSQGDCLYVMLLRLNEIYHDEVVVLMALRSTFLARANRNHEGEDVVNCGMKTTLCFDETVPANPSQVIPWQDWGPTGTRILSYPSDHWVCYNHDTRCIRPIRRTGPDDPNTTNLYDFNPYAIRRYRLPPNSPEAAHDSSMWKPLEFETKIWPDESPFVEDVTTRLPGIVARVELHKLARIHFNRHGPFPLGPLLGPMLAEDHIVVTVPRFNWGEDDDDAFSYLYM